MDTLVSIEPAVMILSFRPIMIDHRQNLSPCTLISRKLSEFTRDLHATPACGSAIHC